MPQLKLGRSNMTAIPNKIGIVQTGKRNDCLLNGYFMLLFKMEEQFTIV